MLFSKRYYYYYLLSVNIVTIILISIFLLEPHSYYMKILTEWSEKQLQMNPNLPPSKKPTEPSKTTKKSVKFKRDLTKVHYIRIDESLRGSQRFFR